MSNYRKAQRSFWVSVCCLGLSSLALAGDRLDQILEKNEIVIAHREASVPLSYLDNGKPIGYSLDICHAVVESLKKQYKRPNLTIRYLVVTSQTRIPAIAEGKADLECGSTTNTAERRQKVDFTIPHFISTAKFLVRKADRIQKIEDLRGKTVVSTQGTTNIKTLHKQNDERVLNLNILESKDHAEGFRFLVEKKVDAFAMDDILLYGLRASAANPDDYEVIGKPMTIEPYAIMLPKNQKRLKAVVDGEIARMITSFEIYTLYKKWFESPIPPRGINLNVPMSFLLRDSFKFPTDKVND
ncbi:amino acid ABC transporter substrate-binding protein [Parvibium lacunae]|uniref:Amino acid ABC transporter substrate-binding protein n=1 Tax=Parvibium lacunae TaxID=1888893 RepID=A0A368L4E2_9BURK|nr:amino acid ABC transporter substrate-binding protein [Parvibium lacunae]RCS58437.1 amino acid ABC transporter substrate-binding protein [Parvibium lacunae]